MSENVNEILAGFGQQPEAFAGLVANPSAFISGRDLDDQDAALLTAVANRSRALAFFTPKTLNELANEVGGLPLSGSPNFDPLVADTFRDSYTDNYSDSIIDIHIY